MNVFWDVYHCYTFGSEATSSVKKLPSPNLTYQGHLRFLSFVRMLGHRPKQKDGGSYLFRIQTNYSGWLLGCPDLLCFSDVGIYLGYLSSNFGES